LKPQRRQIRLLSLATSWLVCFSCWLSPCQAQDSSPAESNSAAGSEPTGPWGQTIALDSLGKAAIGLETTTVVRKPLARRINTTGKIQALPTREFDQQAVLVGRILHLLVNIGDSVKAGQTLAIVDSPEINQLATETLQSKAQLEAEIKQTTSQLDAEIDQNKVSLGLADANYKRNKRLFEEGIGAQKDMQGAQGDLQLAASRLQASQQKKDIVLKALQARLRVSSNSLRSRLRQLGVTDKAVDQMLAQQQTILQVPITASRGGVVTDIQASVGQSVNQSAPLFGISDLSHVWAIADIYEDDMSRIRIGQKVTVRVKAFPNKIFEGKLNYIGKLVSPQTRTLPVGVEIVNPGLQLKPDMFADLSIETTDPTLAIIVPSDAVVDRNGHSLAFVEARGGYQAYRVKVGRHFGDDVEILEGLTPGQKVVVHGTFQLSAELLKTHGYSDLFSQPTQGDHAEHSLESNTQEHSGPSMQLIIVLLAAAFVFGFIFSVLIVKGQRRTPFVEKELPAKSDPLSKG